MGIGAKYAALAAVVLALAGCETIPLKKGVDAGGSIPEGTISAPAHDPDYDTPPRLLSGHAPIYPISQLLSHKSGHSKIEYTIGTDGHTSDFRVIETDYRYYADHAIIAVQKWRYAPATKDGHPVAIRVRQVFNYSIR